MASNWRLAATAYTGMLFACAISRRQSRDASYSRGSSPTRRFRGAPAPTAIVVPAPANAVAVLGMVRLAGCPISAARSRLHLWLFSHRLYLANTASQPSGHCHGIGPTAFRAGILHRQSWSKRTRRRGDAKGKQRIDLLFSASLRELFFCATKIGHRHAAELRQPRHLCRCMRYDPIGARRIASCPRCDDKQARRDLQFPAFGIK
jgi:hypothetical protein